jgi:hypothetical protein
MTDDFDPYEPLTEIELAMVISQAAPKNQDAYTQPTLVQRLVAEVRRLRAEVEAARRKG